jgi:carboxylate-amine ligase
MRRPFGRRPAVSATRRAAAGLIAGGTARHARAVFDRVASFTVGAEEELLLVDPLTHLPAPLGEQALLVSEGDARVASELRACQVEGISPVCVSVADVARELASVRTLLHRRLVGRALLVAAGTHPLAEHPGPVTRGPRYERIAAENPCAARGLLTGGLHVHVAVGGADRALAVHNALRGYLPELTALAANAPYHRGEDTGLATVRPRLNGLLPRAGVPPAFASWEDWVGLIDWSRTGGLYPDASFQWWDLRLHPGHGTIEVRAADAQLRVEDTAAVVALVQSLVARLATRFDEGEELPVHPTERISENRWLAARDGVEGELLDLVRGTRVPTTERLHALVEELLPVAASLGCDEELLGVGRLVLAGGAARQRRTVAERGLDGLVPWLADETVLHAHQDASAEPALVESGA